MFAKRSLHSMPTRWLIVSAILFWTLLIRFISFFVLTRGDTLYHTGGLFYAFSAAIREGHFSIPVTIQHYTAHGLPYAYPPLGFYVEAVVQALFDPGPNSILLLNAIFSTLAVAAFGLLVLDMPQLKGTGWWVAMLAFATLPSTYGEQLPGEGLAESIGSLAFILFLWRLFRADIKSPTVMDVLLLGVTLGFSVLAAPGSAYAAPVVLVLWLILQLWNADNNRQRLRAFLAFSAVAGTGFAVASPYLIGVVIHHGVQVFVDPFLAESTDFTLTLFMFFDAFTMRNYRALVVPALGQLLAVWGLLYVIIDRQVQFLIPTLFLLCMPREGVWLSAVFLSLLAGLGWQKILLPGLQTLSNTVTGSENQQVIGKALITLVVFGAGLSPAFALLIAISGHAFYQDFVQPEEQIVLDMIEADTPPDATFLVFANEIEWFPLLTRRTVLNVEYGTEWMPEVRDAILTYNSRLRTCTSEDELEALLLQMNYADPAMFPFPDYLYISKNDTVVRGNPIASPQLIEDLRTSSLFAVYTENDETLVLKTASISF